MIKRLVSGTFGALARNKLLFAMVVLTVLASAALLVGIFWPAFKDPKNRTYTSKYGHGQIKRQLGIPFEVKTEQVSERRMMRRIMGEGMMSAKTVLVPMIPTSIVLEVKVQEGDVVKRGDILATLDDTRARLKVETAKLAYETALAELKRVEAGSAYILAQERPEKDEMKLKSSREALRLLREKEKLFEEMVSSGAAARMDLLELREQILQAELEVEQSEYNLQMSSTGSTQSHIIARNAVSEAKNALAHREYELATYQIVAPADGVIERVLVHPGEYNQDTGRPAFIVSSDIWFEAHFDQSAINKVKEGHKALVYLESFPGRTIDGEIEKVVPIVTYNLGGPETNRPIRPRGTGAPEWPATFKARIRLEPRRGVRLVPGLTGFAQINNLRKVLAVPKKAVVSFSAGHGVVHVIEDEKRHLRQVRCGVVDGKYIEIIFGLREGETVITEGHEVLENGDVVEPVQET